MSDPDNPPCVPNHPADTVFAALPGVPADNVASPCEIKPLPAANFEFGFTLRSLLTIKGP